MFLLILIFFLFSWLVLIIAGVGIVLLHKNLIIVFMCVELILVALAFNFFLSSVVFVGSFGFFFGYLLLIIAGAESSLALAILTSYFFIEQSINVESVSKLKG
jgi:NADH-quinone oxidoreductase subunit K